MPSVRARASPALLRISWAPCASSSIIHISSITMYYCLHSITLSSILVISLTVYALPMTHCNKSGYCVIKGERMDIVGQQKNGDYMLAFPYKKDLGSCWAAEYLLSYSFQPSSLSRDIVCETRLLCFYSGKPHWVPVPHPGCNRCIPLVESVIHRRKVYPWMEGTLIVLFHPSRR